MNAPPSAAALSCSSRSARARHQLESVPGEPLFLADWSRVLMMHLEVDAVAAQKSVPFELDLFHDRAFVTLVAFTLENLRPCRGGRLAAWLFRPIANHDFLNVRTYVTVNGEPGIHFLGEWLSNRMAVRLGPPTFALPYHYARIRYEHNERDGELSGCVSDPSTGGAVRYTSQLSEPVTFRECNAGTLDEWLMERYTAFNAIQNRRKLFRVWHPPWLQSEAHVTLEEISLLTRHWPWLRESMLHHCRYSPGVKGVWMGRPMQCRNGGQ